MMKKNTVGAILVGLFICAAIAVAAQPQKTTFPSLGIASQTTNFGLATAKPQETPTSSSSPSQTAPEEKTGIVYPKTPAQPDAAPGRFPAKENGVVEVKTKDNTIRNTQDISDAIANQADFAYTYFNNAIYRIYCKEQRLTDIQLQVGETILFIGAGDTVRWQVDTDVSGSGATQQTHVYVKPLRAEIATNLIINTDRHNYHCEIIAGNTFSPIISWIYPKEKSLAVIREQQAAENEVTGQIDYASMNFNFKITGKNYPWKPKMVFADQTHVYIQMPATMKTDEAPALFIKEGDKLQLVNYRVRNGYYVVDRLFKKAELRCGKDTVTIKKTRQTRQTKDY